MDMAEFLNITAHIGLFHSGDCFVISSSGYSFAMQMLYCLTIEQTTKNVSHNEIPGHLNESENVRLR